MPHLLEPALLHADRITTRTLVLWCPDWPTVTALKEHRLPVATPAVVLSGNRVLSCTQSARVEGVRIGQRRREAESHCPNLRVFKADAERDARMFEAVAVAVEEIAPGVEILRPGMIACPAKGPARYFGSEQAAAEKLADAVEAQDIECRVGAADVLPVAVLAARQSVFVPPGGSAAFCAALPIDELARDSAVSPPDRVELIDLLKRLGITTMGEFAALPEAKVITRFGGDAAVAHRLAAGRAERGLSRRHIPAELVVEQICDPPLDRVDTAAFLARALAERFHTRLAAGGLACTRLSISAHTEQGRTLSRTWRCVSPLTPAATADRLRWQLDGWITARARTSGATQLSETDPIDSVTDAVTLLRLEPVEAVDAGRIQYGLWGSSGEDDERANWALARVQGLLGPESVVTPVLAGGRGVAERIRFLPWGQEKVEEGSPGAPWPGRIPAPSPTRLTAAENVGKVLDVLDIHGGAVGVDDRGFLSASPCYLEPRTGPRRRISGWAGPWLFDERWWQGAPTIGSGTDSAERGNPLARLQILLEDGPVLLVGYGRGTWSLEGVYD
ncbi:DNA polymerase Y family protein [Nakamurella silvestris]|nr:DNA polymerase Y family protein [Nakamurella silvestris]